MRHSLDISFTTLNFTQALGEDAVHGVVTAVEDGGLVEAQPVWTLRLDRAHLIACGRRGRLVPYGRGHEATVTIGTAHGAPKSS